MAIMMMYYIYMYCTFCMVQEDVTEPTEFCMKCDSLLPLTQLRKHVAVCKGTGTKDSADTDGYI